MMSQTCETLFSQYRERTAAGLDNAAWTNRRLCHGIVLLLATAPLAAAFVLQADEEGLSLLGYPWPFHCWLHNVVGIKCALCGLSRSFCCLAHGDLRASLSFHPLGPAVFAVFCFEVLYRLRALVVHPAPVGKRLARLHLGLAALTYSAVLVHWLFYLRGLFV